MSITDTRSRRAVLAGIASAAVLPIAAAVPTAAPALLAEAATDPAAIAAEAAVPSEALALVERCRKGDRRWDVLYKKIDCAEVAARSEHGRRPIALIAWRNYSHIGGSEIERARDEFIRAGIDENVVQAEYRSAKKRYGAALRAEEDWDRKAGLSDLRKEYEDNGRETRALWKALSKVPLKNNRDAVAIIGLLRERARKFDELSDGWEVAAFLHASRFLVQTAASEGGEA
jgi:hypothetical protein